MNPHRPTEPHYRGEQPERWADIAEWEADRADRERRMVNWLLSGAGRHWMHWQAEQGKQPTREDVAEAMEVGP